MERIDFTYKGVAYFMSLMPHFGKGGYDAGNCRIVLGSSILAVWETSQNGRYEHDIPEELMSMLKVACDVWLGSQLIYSMQFKDYVEMASDGAISDAKARRK